MHSLLNNYQQYTSTNLFHNNNYTFTAAPQGSYTYKLEVWGAAGYSASDKGGKGGYAYGNISRSAGSSLYICVGSAGGTTSDGNKVDTKTAGYNGGGYAQRGGGGATHIATAKRGVLKNYASYKSEVLIVGGGGGACDPSNSSDNQEWGGHGGGTTGGDGWYRSSHTEGGKGGTQSAGGAGKGAGSFGQGGSQTTSDFPSDASSAGGGGWYGGGASYGTAGGGGGGSGYIGGVTSASMSSGVRSGNGYATITLTRW